MNEDEIIRLIQGKVKTNELRSCIGIGDDAAVIPGPNGISTLVTTDLLTDGVHFLSSRISARELGQKSLAVNLSDIAAMGGTPTFAFLSIALPSELAGSGWVDEFLNSFTECAAQHSVQVLGGDTTRSLHSLFISVTVIGEAPCSNVKLRSSAKNGDKLAISGTLGDSWAGLNILLNHLPQDPYSLELLRRHHSPNPAVLEGTFLGTRPEVTSMMDISDGLITDLTRLAQASSVSATFHLEAIPVSAELAQWAATNRLDPHEIAATGGEDYRLLFTISPSHIESLLEAYVREIGQPFYIIGEVFPGEGVTAFKSGCSHTLQISSYSHF